MPKEYANLVDYGSIALRDYPVSLEKNDYRVIDIESDLPYTRKLRRRETAIDAEDQAIESEIRSSTFILKINADDMDEDDFIPYSAETRLRAVNFLRRLATHAHSCGFSGIGVPEILPAEKGGVSLFWRGSTKQLLMTFPADKYQMISYYGKSGLRDTAGRFPDTDFTPDLIYWLAN